MPAVKSVSPGANMPEDARHTKVTKLIKPFSVPRHQLGQLALLHQLIQAAAINITMLLVYIYIC